MEHKNSCNDIEIKFDEICEGKAVLRVPHGEEIFYNPVQEFNRDLTIEVINVFFDKYKDEIISLRKKNIIISKRTKEREFLNLDVSKMFNECDFPIVKPHPISLQIENRLIDEFVILEALAATGLRSLRYALEVDQAKFIISNDILKTAVQTIAYNIRVNNLQEKMICTHMDASHLMSHLSSPLTNRIEVIDLDPYGSAAIFIDSAIKAVADGGLLCVTCTDMATLCGNNTDACFYKYGSFSVKAPFCHEMALRIVLNCIETTASRYQRYIKPLISISVDFYVRLFVRVFTGAEEAKRSSLKRAHLIYCDNCFSFKLHKLGCLSKNNTVKPNKLPTIDDLVCVNCEYQMRMYGPVYCDSIHDQEFVKVCVDYNKLHGNQFKTSQRIHGILTTIYEELHDAPFYYSLSDCFSVLRCSTAPAREILCDLIRNGKKVSKSHAKKSSVKTDATSEEIWDTIKAWIKIKSQNFTSTSIKNINAKILLEKPLKYSHNFDVDRSLLPQIETKILRYQHNPAPFWGPLARNKVGTVGINSNVKKRKME